MRTIRELDALFPAIRQRLLAATILRPEKSWFLTELAAHLHTSPSSLQREVESLSLAGILRQWRDGRRLYVTAERESPIFIDLSHLLEKTAGLIPTLREELNAFFDRIDLAFVFGSTAQSEERAGSDIDLMLVGSVGLYELTEALRRLEIRLGREINPVIYSLSEFQRKIATHDHFLTSVLKKDKLFLKGEQHELAAVA